MVGKKDDFEVVVVGRGAVVRGIDGVVEVVPRRLYFPALQ